MQGREASLLRWFQGWSGDRSPRPGGRHSRQFFDALPCLSTAAGLKTSKSPVTILILDHSAAVVRSLASSSGQLVLRLASVLLSAAFGAPRELPFTHFPGSTTSPACTARYTVEGNRRAPTLRGAQRPRGRRFPSTVDLTWCCLTVPPCYFFNPALHPWRTPASTE